MSGDDDHRIEQLLETPDLADALGSDRFKQFLDHLPFGIAVSEHTAGERIVYVNPEFERLTERPAVGSLGRGWEVLASLVSPGPDGRTLANAVIEGGDHIGTFAVPDGGGSPLDAWSNLIEGDDGAPAFRLVALIARSGGGKTDDEASPAVALKDAQLRDLQHRVKNNLQMITSLIRFEARALRGREAGERFERLAGRVGTLALLYQSITVEGQAAQTVDLGIYLSEIASAVMRAQAREGIRFDMKVDTWPVSLNVAMPTGLVVHELLSNALQHGFVGREGGEIEIHGLVDAEGWRVVVADNGVGLPPGVEWPAPGTMSALFVRSLQQNARATIRITSEPGKGVRAEILFGSSDSRQELSPGA